MRADDLSETIVAQIGSAAGSGDLKFHQGLVLSWNSTTGANVVSIAGTEVPDVPVLSSAGLVALAAGDPVMVLRYKSKYFIVGRIFAPEAGLVQPQWPIVIYPMFAAGYPADYASVGPGVTARWEGRIRVSHPKIEVDGVWGNGSGVGSNTYQLRLDNKVMGQWTTTGGLVVNHGSVLAGLTTGGFDVSEFLGRDWLSIQVFLSSNGSTGVVAFQPLGVFFRQS